MKRVAGESEPIVVVPLVVEPIEVSIALRLVPPHIRHIAVTIEGNVRNIIRITVQEKIYGLYTIWDYNPLILRTKYLLFLF